MIKTRRVTTLMPQYKTVVDMYNEAFPDSERLPLLYLKFLSWRKGVSFTAYYDGSDIIGMTYTVETDQMIFVLYLTTNVAVRSNGYGTKILQELIRRKALMSRLWTGFFGTARCRYPEKFSKPGFQPKMA